MIFGDVVKLSFATSRFCIQCVPNCKYPRPFLRKISRNILSEVPETGVIVFAPDLHMSEVEDGELEKKENRKTKNSANSLILDGWKTDTYSFEEIGDRGWLKKGRGVHQKGTG